MPATTAKRTRRDDRAPSFLQSLDAMPPDRAIGILDLIREGFVQKLRLQQAAEAADREAAERTPPGD